MQNETSNIFQIKTLSGKPRIPRVGIPDDLKQAINVVYQKQILEDDYLLEAIGIDGSTIVRISDLIYEEPPSNAYYIGRVKAEIPLPDLQELIKIMQSIQPYYQEEYQNTLNTLNEVRTAYKKDNVRAANFEHPFRSTPLTDIAEANFGNLTDAKLFARAAQIERERMAFVIEGLSHLNEKLSPASVHTIATHHPSEPKPV